MASIVLVDGRFELLNRPDRIDVFDIRNLQKGADGKVRPIAVIALSKPESDREAGKTALQNLLEGSYITKGEYLQFLEAFLSTQSVVETRANVHS
jgi:hypothetical protein